MCVVRAREDVAAVVRTCLLTRTPAIGLGGRVTCRPERSFLWAQAQPSFVGFLCPVDPQGHLRTASRCSALAAVPEFPTYVGKLRPLSDCLKRGQFRTSPRTCFK